MLGCGIAWSAIVKNEEARIERCVKSLLPHIDCGVVVDTGSTDDTVAIITRLFDKAGKPVEIRQAPFENFSQARNVALRAARESKLDWDYLLLVDADMELRVTDPDWKRSLNGGPSYDARQQAGTLTYWNRRLLHRSAQGVYLCPTHEYLDVPTAGNVEGIWFQDHADGSNRPGKFENDIRLLEEGLKTETSPGLVQRMEFYLAQSYFDKGDWAKAAEHYKKRVELGGWDEERWNAQLHYAHCLGNLGDNPRFVWEMLQAYGMRPSRAEVLYDLAKYFRERGQNHVSLLFSETGLQIPDSQDQLFVNRYVYDTGIREEYGICAYYDPIRRDRGAVISDQLALERKGTWQSREQARTNLYWYLKPLAEHIPSFSTARLPFPDHDGYVPCNPSVINHNGRLLILVRTVNYTITEEGRYAIRSPDGSPAASDWPIDTRNYLCRLADDGTTDRIVAINRPNLPPPRFELVRGFEDSRLFEWKQELWTLSTVRELSSQGSCEQVLAPLVYDRQAAAYADTWSKILSPTGQHEKNWMPWVRGDELCFVYRLGTLVNPQGDIIAQHETAVDSGHISGGSQVVSIADNVNLCIVHEARAIPGCAGLRFYQHRFACLAADGRLVALSRPFFFAGRHVEFCAGMAYFPDKRQLMLSYGVKDREAWIATVDLNQVLKFIFEGML